MSGAYFRFNLQFVFNLVLNKAKSYLIIEAHINVLYHIFLYIITNLWRMKEAQIMLYNLIHDPKIMEWYPNHNECNNNTRK